MKNIGNTLPKVDARANMLGGAVYVEDYPRLPGTLIVKALRSPYAHAYIRSIDTRIACKVPGVAAIFTYEDAPDIRYSANGCTYPESCPYDRKILDRTVRYVGDEVALVAAETEAAAARALRLIRVQYDVLPAVLDPEESATGNVVIQQGTLKLQADAIVANLNSNNQIKTVTANGSPAKFQQQMDSNKGLARGEGKRINYNAETGIITLSGNAFLSQNGATFRGENLKYSMSKGDIQADGGSTGQKKGRIQIVIPPSAQQSLSGVND